MPPSAVRKARGWLHAKLRNFYSTPQPGIAAAVRRAVAGVAVSAVGPVFANPFRIEDLDCLDDDALRDILAQGAFGITSDTLAAALCHVPTSLARRVALALPAAERQAFEAHLGMPVASAPARAARQRVLDAFFWELTYWKLPQRYEELTDGERLHPGIFAWLAPQLRGMVALDAGAGAGRATRECLRAGARHVYAVEPSVGLRRILARKLAAAREAGTVEVLPGRFDALPLPADSVDVAVCCAALTAEPEHGGEPGLAELVRVTRPGGCIVVIWPRPEDYRWLAAHGFHYVALPVPRGLSVRFRSLRSARRVARLFYARNPAVLGYLRTHRRPEVPFWVLGFNPPHDYCWLRVRKPAAPQTECGQLQRTGCNTLAHDGGRHAPPAQRRAGTHGGA